MTERKSSSVLAAPLHGAAHVLRRVPGAGTVGRAAQGTLNKVGAVSPRGRRLAVYTGAGVLGVAGVVEWPVALTGAAVAWLTQPRPAGTTDGPDSDLARDGAVQGSSGSAVTGAVTADGEPAGAAASRTAPAKRASTAATRTTARKTTAKAATRTASRTTAKTASKTVGKTAGKSAAKTAGRATGRSAGKASGAGGARDIASAALKSAKTAPETPSASGRSGRGKPSGTQASAGPLGPTARPDRTTL
ncbi:hypothetical protein [Streptomyces naganishii]|uniref:Uncharacterized protein n=1 Tax=Streptomyces naganishii JCM 4654 TaxID=1306179 RepID=A0A918Y1J3_9ACTN|nr:hypothetical protein GCM10010508_13710 [Streptomyces naganishii JCM 4654]